jgi:hopene-associated glycosyltransferase HpnB
MLTLTAIACAMWVGLLVLPFRPWSTREHIEAAVESIPVSFPDVTVLIPARDEAQSIVRTLRGVAAQGKLARIILVDDQSSDGTGELAASIGIPELHIQRGRAPDAGWSGKLWALHQGLGEVRTPYLLLLDADIELAPGMLEALREKLLGEQRTLVSVMAALSMRSPWEKLLIPPFIYFFKLIYPFALGNSSCRWVAAAAGGCILLRTDALREIGGFSSLRGALIDDCTLARRIKGAGGRIWLGLSHGVRAVRPYDGLGEIWNMVARTAFTQLRYSVTLLLLCTILMGISFIIPIVGLLSGSGSVKALALGGLLAMAAS